MLLLSSVVLASGFWEIFNEKVIFKLIFNLDGLAADWITGNLYYTDVQQKVIGVLDYTGSFYGVLISTGKETNPRAIILDPATR